MPPADNLSLLSSDSNVVADDEEFDAIGLVGVEGCVLLFGESKVEDIAGIVPCEVSGGSGNRPMGLLYDDDRAGERLNGGEGRRRGVPGIVGDQVDGPTDLARTWRGKHVSANGSCVR